MTQRAVWTRAKHRVGLERPGSLASLHGQRASWVAPVHSGWTRLRLFGVLPAHIGPQQARQKQTQGDPAKYSAKMKFPLTQFGARENTASSRQHTSRLAVDLDVKDVKPVGFKEKNPRVLEVSPLSEEPRTSFISPHHAAPRAATRGEKEMGERQLLTVHEVAELLRVPVSWVYGRTRKRSTDRLPGYRIGKYWRFRADEVMSWVQSRPAGREVA